ncbi:MAG TPA: cytochrome P450 [Dehalococcoidia bacterium]|jgi:cytochrome P450|nr:cytochrome P450 [Dehalococcoidia bacterium]
MTNATENSSPTTDAEPAYKKSRRLSRIQRRGLDPLSGNMIQKFLKRSIVNIVISMRSSKEMRRTGVVYNPLSEVSHQDPQTIWRNLRYKDPIHWSDVVQGWVVSRHSDVDSILRDFKRFSNVPQMLLEQNKQSPTIISSPDEFDVNAPTMLQSDPPDHTRLRTLVSHAFTPKAIALWKTTVETVADDLIENISEKKSFDFLTEYANLLPLIVIAELIGVPHTDRDLFKSWSVKVARTLEPTITASQAEEADQASIELAEYFDQIIQSRRIQPKDDLITVLIQAEEEGDKLNHKEVIAALTLILIAGHETTSNLLGNGMYALLSNPEQLTWLRENPEQVDVAVEELLRFDSPVAVNARTALEDVDVGGVPVKAGDTLILLQGSGNFDENLRDHSDALALENGDKNHLSFGRGIHYCLGAPLARLEGQIGFQKVLDRWSDIQLAESPEYKDHIVLRGLKTLNVQVND